EVQDPDTPLEALAADADELVCRPLEPGGHHAAIVVPDGAEPLPVASIAPDDPVLDQLSDRCLVGGGVVVGHGAPYETAWPGCRVRRRAAKAERPSVAITTAIGTAESTPTAPTSGATAAPNANCSTPRSADALPAT